MHHAPVAVRIKDIVKLDGRQGFDEGRWFHFFIFSKVMVRLVQVSQDNASAMLAQRTKHFVTFQDCFFP